MNAYPYQLKRNLYRSGLLLLALVCFLLIVAPALAADKPVNNLPQTQPTLAPGQVENNQQPAPASTDQPTIVTVTRMEARPVTSPVILLAAFAFMAVLFGSAWLTRRSGQDR